MDPEYANGTVQLASANPLDELVFSANNALSTNDLNTLVRGFKAVRSIFNVPEAKVFYGEELIPGPSVSTDAQIEAWIQANLNMVFHYYGSAKMGNAGDPLRVVDNNLRVVGVNGLRVCDSSIIPNVVSALLMATITGIGEQGSALILGTYPH